MSTAWVKTHNDTLVNLDRFHDVRLHTRTYPWHYGVKPPDTYDLRAVLRQPDGDVEVDLAGYETYSEAKEALEELGQSLRRGAPHIK